MAVLRLVGVNERERQAVEQVLSDFLKPVNTPELLLSRTCAHVLVQSVAAMPLKKVENDILSSSTVVFTALLLAQRVARDDGLGTTIDDRIGDEAVRLRNWGQVLEGTYAIRLDDLIEDFFKTPPAPVMDEDTLLPQIPSAVSGVCSPGLQRNLAAAGAQKTVVRIDTLVLRLMDDAETGIAKRFSTPENQEIREALLEASATGGGRSPSMVREAAPTELALRVQDYAVALATVLRTAKGEFTFALFGPWGSGKTTLTTLLKPLLEKPKEFQASAVAGDEVFARRTYAVVFHNAWKYRSRPESWIYAYRSLAETASGGFGPIGRLMLALRVSVLRKGPWPLTAALLSLAMLAIPFSAKIQLAVLALSATGFFAGLYLAAVTSRVTTRVRELFAQHLRLAPVDEKLGMLALVGDDVRALLAAWVRPLDADPDDGSPDRFPWASLALPLGVLTAIGAAWLVGLLGWWAFILDLTAVRSLLSVLPQAWAAAFVENDLTTVPSGPPFAELGVLVVWTALAAALVVLPWLVHGGRPNRVLMIIDDLDRCSPDEMLDVIEGMRLLVDDRQVNRRLQILMLVDEAALGHSIARRYDTMIQERAADSGDSCIAAASRMARLEVVAEQNEKLFACHLRLARLTDADVAALVGSLAGSEVAALKRAQQAERSLRQARQMQEALEAYELAVQRKRKADEHFRDVRDGKPRDLIDEDRPNEQQPPMGVRIAITGGEPLPPHPDTVRRRKRTNEEIKAWNYAQAKKSPGERLSERPEVVRERDNAERELEEAQRKRELFSPPPNAEEPSPEHKALFENDDVRFTALDIEQLQRLIPNYLRHMGRRPSPRAIRILLFKIQLCRLLLQLRYPWRPSRTRSVEAILAAFRATSQPPLANGDPEDEIIRIARQVV